MRPRLPYANVMATIAVFIALGGASYAALKLPKSSVGTKQLKKNSVTTAKIKNEAVTAAKVKKGTLTGTQVDASTLGTVPSAGHAASADNASTATNANQLGGVPASQYLTTSSTLQSGETETGVWAANAGTGGYGVVAINFNPKLGSPIPTSNQIYVPEETTKPHCPGFREADPGYLCVYASFENQMTFTLFYSGFAGGGGEPGEPEGTVLYFSATEPNSNARGSWTFTAP
jgi:hypothetical protein